MLGDPVVSIYNGYGDGLSSRTALVLFIPLYTEIGQVHRSLSKSFFLKS